MEPKDSDVESVENWDDIIGGGDVGKIQDCLQRELKGLLRTWRRRLRGYSSTNVCLCSPRDKWPDPKEALDV